MKRRAFSTLILAAAALAATGQATAQQTIKLTAVSGHPPVFLWVKTMDEVFIPEIDKRLAASGKYKINWTKAWGGTLAKLGSESRSVGDGVADIGLVSTLFEAPKFPMQNVTYFTPFGTDNIAQVSKTVAEMQAAIPAMGNSWTKNGLVYLGGMALDTYHIFTTFPLNRVEDLQGKKISAPGPAANWINGTGAVPVAGSLNTYYEDIKSGVSNGTIVFSTGAWAAKVHEVAPHITKVNFGAMYAGGIVVNKSRFDRLPAEVQQAMREAGEVWSSAFAAAQSKSMESALEKMAAAGAKITELSAVERKRWADTLPQVAKTWANDTQSKGMPGNEVLNAYQKALVKAGTDLPRDWTK
jgi:TRAP-type C4-dicarboxylate transport system substrate-binding protein